MIGIGRSWRPGIWRHQDCLDMDLEVLYCREGYSAEAIQVTVNYVSRTGGYKFHGSPDTVKIKRKDLPKWSHMGPSWRASYGDQKPG